MTTIGMMTICAVIFTALYAVFVNWRFNKNANKLDNTIVLPADQVLNSMTKLKLDEYAATLEIALDRRMTKANMISDLKEQSVQK